MENKQTLEELADYVMNLMKDVSARRRLAYLNEDTYEYAEAVGTFNALQTVYKKIKSINADTTTD